MKIVNISSQEYDKLIDDMRNNREVSELDNARVVMESVRKVIIGDLPDILPPDGWEAVMREPDNLQNYLDYARYLSITPQSRNKIHRAMFEKWVVIVSALSSKKDVKLN